jgi:hypothetical protein
MACSRFVRFTRLLASLVALRPDTPTLALPAQLSGYASSFLRVVDEFEPQIPCNQIRFSACFPDRVRRENCHLQLVASVEIDLIDHLQTATHVRGVFAPLQFYHPEITERAGPIDSRLEEVLPDVPTPILQIEPGLVPVAPHDPQDHGSHDAETWKNVLHPWLVPQCVLSKNEDDHASNGEKDKEGDGAPHLFCGKAYDQLTIQPVI